MFNIRQKRCGLGIGLNRFQSVHPTYIKQLGERRTNYAPPVRQTSVKQRSQATSKKKDAKTEEVAVKRENGLTTKPASSKKEISGDKRQRQNEENEENENKKQKIDIFNTADLSDDDDSSSDESSSEVEDIDTTS